MDASAPGGDLQTVRIGDAQAPTPTSPRSAPLRLMVVATASSRDAPVAGIARVTFYVLTPTLYQAYAWEALFSAVQRTHNALHTLVPVSRLRARSQPPAGQGFALLQATGRWAAGVACTRVLSRFTVCCGGSVRVFGRVEMTAHKGLVMRFLAMNTKTRQWEVRAYAYGLASRHTYKSKDRHTQHGLSAYQPASQPASRCSYVPVRPSCVLVFVFVCAHRSRRRPFLPSVAQPRPPHITPPYMALCRASCVPLCPLCVVQLSHLTHHPLHLAAQLLHMASVQGCVSPHSSRRAQ